MGNFLAPLFGTGKHGTKVSSSNEDITAVRQACNITAASNLLNVTDHTAFADGDLVMIHKSRGSTNTWEYRFARIVSRAGNVLTLDRNIDIAFSDSGAEASQVVQCKEYRSWKINAGITVSPAAWDGDKGGIIPVFVQGIFENLGALEGSALGYRGGVSGSASNSGFQGEGSAGAGSQGVNTANGTGAGAGLKNSQDSGNTGTGGGHKDAGTNGPIHNEFGVHSGPAAIGGGTLGNDQLTIIGFGGAGSGGGHDTGGGSTAGDGGRSGGILIVIAREVKNDSGTIYSNGQTGEFNPDNHNGGGGPGSGGSIYIQALKADGMDTLSVTPGSQQWGCGTQHSNQSGTAGKGRMRLNIAKITGSIHADASVDTSAQTWKGSVGIL